MLKAFGDCLEVLWTIYGSVLFPFAFGVDDMDSERVAVKGPQNTDEAFGNPISVLFTEKFDFIDSHGLLSVWLSFPFEVIIIFQICMAAIGVSAPTMGADKPFILLRASGIVHCASS
jgi:hypothetical protein